MLGHMTILSATQRNSRIVRIVALGLLTMNGTNETRKPVRAMVSEEAVYEMARAAGMTLAEASRRIGRNSSFLASSISLTRTYRKRGTSRPCGMNVDTFAAVAEAMGFRLALVGHGEVIEVMDGRTSR
jgi:hypothetical protein